MDQKTDPVCLPITEEYYGMATFLLSFHFSIEMHSPSEIHVSLHSTFRRILCYLMLCNNQACYLNHASNMSRKKNNLTQIVTPVSSMNFHCV